MSAKSNQIPLILALNNIRSLLNVGAIFRTTEGAGVKQIILGGITPQPPRHEISKTALGAVEAMNWKYVIQLKDELLELKAKGYHLYALEQTDKSQDFYQQPLSFPAVLVVGNEKTGIEPEILQICDTHLELPMLGKAVHSLNVGTATGIALYEFVRQFCYHK